MKYLLLALFFAGCSLKPVKIYDPREGTIIEDTVVEKLGKIKDFSIKQKNKESQKVNDLIKDTIRGNVSIISSEEDKFLEDFINETEEDTILKEFVENEDSTKSKKMIVKHKNVNSKKIVFQLTRGIINGEVIKPRKFVVYENKTKKMCFSDKQNWPICILLKNNKGALYIKSRKSIKKYTKYKKEYFLSVNRRNNNLEFVFTINP
jgi:hypothetical protein